jgi:hypothetical protein
MKKLIILSFFLGFGAMTALMGITILLMATGHLKQSILGGYSWDFGKSDVLVDYEKKQAISRAIKFTDAVSLTTSPGNAKLVFTISNPSDSVCDDVVSTSVVYYLKDKVVGIPDLLVSVNLQPGKSGKATDEIRNNVPVEYDRIEIINKE